MKYSFLFIVFTLWFFPQYVYSQIQSRPHLTTEMVNENGLLVFSGSEHWKYHPGDNLQWADPEFDDSGWHAISPAGLAIEEMPDSLWDGYGWWRYTFTADSSFYGENWNLYFYGWGAAEVYLDGHFVHRFGDFSIHPDGEKMYSPPNQISPPIDIQGKHQHTIAVRYSYHQAKRYNVLMKENAGNLGFGFGFGTHAFNKYTAQRITYQSFTLFFSAAVLFVLLLFHLMLFYKFPKDRSNLFISIIIGLWLISVVTVYNFVYTDVTMYWNTILTLIWAFSSQFAVVFLPFVITAIFRIDKLKKVIWLTAGFPVTVIFTFLNYELINFILLLFYSISFFLVGYICWHAYKSGKRGVHFVAFGVLGTLILVIVYMIYATGFIQMGFQIFYVMIAFLYTLFPMGMTLYVADSYGYLFTSMEKEVSDRTKKLKESLEDLKAAQNQLVQQEKLASLGQLTAGIAHEIKNPLNFVNNFSDLSVELVDEAREELSALSPQPSEALKVLDDVETNLRKIHEHGSRADSIVKSMLEHSRGGSGKMEPTDLNALVKEYVNLSFHGMRAGKNPINVDMEFDLDESIREVPLIAEDFSRVIVNLCNNAFDAMRGIETQNPASLPQGGKSEYRAKLTVRTREDKGNVVVEIEDNGPGIPEEMKDKILQPFFTTKKGTEGTGLGLSITHDIVKAHGGELNFRTDNGSGTVFQIAIDQDRQ